MTDNIIITRIWQDTEFFEVSVECTTANLFISCDYYLTDSHVDNLHTQIQNLLSRKNNFVFWKSGNRNIKYTPCFEVKINRISKTGTVEMELYMEFIDNQEREKHNCIFCIKTEMGLLENFSRRLLSLKENSLGTQASLL